MAEYLIGIAIGAVGCVIPFVVYIMFLVRQSRRERLQDEKRYKAEAARDLAFRDIAFRVSMRDRD